MIRNYLFISLGITLIFILIGSLALNLTRHENQHRFPTDLPLFFARLIDNSNESEKDKLFSQLKESHFAFDLWFLNHDKSLYQSAAKHDLPLDLEKNTLPTEPYEVQPMGQKGLLGPPFMVVKLKGLSPEYVVFGPPAPPHRGEKPFLFIPMGIVFLAVLLSSLVSVSILFLYLKKASALADTVIGNLKAGDLKARFPIQRMNEVGSLMKRFNLMADEVEKLFEKLHTKEKTRVRLLQDLAHDLRTPLASMFNMLSTLSGRMADLSQSTKNEMIDLSLREASYLGKLVEDLLLLSQISDPEGHLHKMRPCNLANLIEEELEKVEVSKSGRDLEIINETQGEDLELNCDPHLMNRLFRNCLDNAFDFATSKVKVSSIRTDGTLTLIIENDGKGFSAEAFKGYGERRLTRVIDSDSKDRISVGLGSVIIKTIAQFHGAEVQPSNLTDPAGRVVGSRIVITFSLTS